LRDLDGVRRWAWSTRFERSRCRIGNVALVIGAVKVPSVPAAIERKSYGNLKGRLVCTYVGKKMLERIPPGHGLLGRWKVSLPVPGASLGPPKVASKQRKLV